MPRPLARSNSRPSSSSKTNIAACSPRLTAPATKVSASSDLPVPAGPEDQHARAALDAAAEQRVQLGRFGRQDLALERLAMLGRDQPREDPHAAGVDDEVVVAAAVALAAIFDDPQPAALGAIFGRQLLEPDHAMRDAVHGPVVRLARQIVEHQHGRPAAREIMLQREDLAPVAKRGLRQQPDLGQAVEHDPRRLHLLERLEDALGRLAKLEIGRIEQALLLILVEQAFRRDQLEDVDPVERPAVRGGAGAQLVLGFGQA